MASIKCMLVLLVCFLTIIAAAPGGFGGGKHEHVVIHVPYHVHTVHHHHTKKVHVPVIKKEIVHVHHNHHDHHDHSHDFHGWW